MAAHQNMQPLQQLIDLSGAAWPLVQDWLSSATNHVEILPVNRQSVDAELLRLQITTRSPLGVIAYATGGILIDHGWLRLLVSGHERMRRTVVSWNGMDLPLDPPRQRGAFLIADDAVGGLGRFYRNFRWEGWEEETDGLPGDSGIIVHPFYWPEGLPIVERLHGGDW